MDEPLIETNPNIISLLFTSIWKNGYFFSRMLFVSQSTEINLIEILYGGISPFQSWILLLPQREHLPGMVTQSG